MRRDRTTMKRATWMVLAVIGVAPAAAAAERLQDWDRFKGFLETRHLEGHEAAAAALLNEVEGRTDDGALAGNIAEELAARPVTQASMKAGIKFLTGEKSEYYCRAVGLVEILGRHADGTSSRVTLVRQQRQLDGYADVRDGSWIYELSSDYRMPMRSDVWMVSATDDSHRLKERRDRGQTTDTGDYQASWADGRRSQSLRTRCETDEPVPMCMATDYHIWGGNVDLGRRIDFDVGAVVRRDRVRDRVRGKNIFLQVTQTVAAHLPFHVVVTQAGVATNYDDCYRVDYRIRYQGLAEEGKVTESAPAKAPSKERQADKS